ncbi:transcriptional activator RinB [Staphylococcus xylosus]|nr:transcriptional regulator [Staphylococcus xylosus]MEB8306607.1 transcriptional activator RinB [Staphylococcus xylosus]
MKSILKTLLIIFLYELSKYVTTEILIKLEANDVVDTFPTDYEIDLWKRL